MKKILTIVLVILFSFTFAIGNGTGDKKFFLSIKGNIISPSDSAYKDIYGSNVIYPGAEIGFKVFKDIYLLAGYEKFSKEGNTLVLDEIAKSTQNITFFGIGYWGSFSENFGYRAELGGISFSYKEEALEEVVKGSKMGFFINGGFVYNFGERFFTSLLLGYSSASDNIEGVDIKLGGFKSSIGVGIKL
jgi:hypothetical protein